MHLSEFKAWFEGFTEDMSGPPSKAQWAKIQKRVKSITADYTPAPIFIDRYVRPYRDWHPYWVSGSTSGVSATVSSNSAVSNASLQLTAQDWQAAGKAEYLAGQ